MPDNNSKEFAIAKKTFTLHLQVSVTSRVTTCHGRAMFATDLADAFADILSPLVPETSSVPVSQLATCGARWRGNPFASD